MGFLNFYATKCLTDVTAVDVAITLEIPPTTPSGRLTLEARNVTQREVISYSSVVGNQIQGVVRGLNNGGVGKTHSKNALVEMNLVAQDMQDLYDAFASFASTNGSGWILAVTLPSAIVYNGNRSYTITYPVSVASIKSKGARSRFTRTVAAPTQCTSLNGTNQYHSKVTPSGFSATDDIVCGAYIKLTSYPAVEAEILSKYNGTSGFDFKISVEGRLKLTGRNAGSGNYSEVVSSQSVPLNKWIHVVAQLDMSAFTATPTTSYTMMDGADVPASVARAGTNPTSFVQAGNLEIGSENGGLLPFSGKIAQVFVTSAKVTQANIRTIYSQGITPADVTALAMVSAYSFNNSLNDLNTSNANNLTANNAAVATNPDSPFGNSGISSNLEYAITTDLSADGLTETLQVPEGCAIPTSGGVSAISYANTGFPYLFPSQKRKWVISSITRATTTQIATGGVWYNIGGMRVLAPVGEWTGSVQSSGLIVGSATQIVFHTFSTSASAETDKEWTGENYFGSAVNTSTPYNRRRPLPVVALTTYYFITSSAGAGTPTLYNIENGNSPVIIELENDYL